MWESLSLQHQLLELLHFDPSYVCQLPLALVDINKGIERKLSVQKLLCHVLREAGEPGYKAGQLLGRRLPSQSRQRERCSRPPLVPFSWEHFLVPVCCHGLRAPDLCAWAWVMPSGAITKQSHRKTRQVGPLLALLCRTMTDSHALRQVLHSQLAPERWPLPWLCPLVSTWLQPDQ